MTTKFLSSLCCISLAMASCSIEHPNDSPPVGKLPLLTQYSNGYYSIKCLNPEKARLYDSSHNYNKDYDYTFNWHFRLITYDIPNTITVREVNY